MTFSEFMFEVDTAKKEFDLDLARYTAYAEASISEYHDNIEESKLRIESESGTDDDLKMLTEEAKKSLNERNDSVIKKIWDACVRTIKKIIESIKNLFTKKTVEDLKGVEKSVKIEIPDYKALEKAQKEFEHTVNKEFSKMNSGRDVDEELLKKAEVDYNNKKKAIEAAKIVVPVAIAVGIITLTINKANNAGDLKMPNFDENNPAAEKFKVLMAKFKSKVEVEKWVNDSKVLKWIKDAARKTKETITNLPTKELPSIEKGKLVPESGDTTSNGEMDLLDSIIEDVENSVKQEQSITVESYLEEIEKSLGIIPSEDDLSVTVEEYLESMEVDLGITEAGNTMGARADQKRLDMMKNQTNRQDALIKQSKGKLEKVDESTIKVPLGQNIYFPRYVNGEISVMVEMQKNSGGIKAGTQIDPIGYNNGQLFSQVKQVLNNPQVKQFFAQLRNMNEVNSAIAAYLQKFQASIGPKQKTESTYSFLEDLENLLKEDECAKYLREAEEYVKKIEEVDLYSAIFEAESEEVKQKIAENTKNSGKSEGVLRQAIRSLIKFIENAAKTISGFFMKLFASKGEKEEFEEMKKLIESDPKYKNMTIRFYDYKKHYEELRKIEDEVLNADKKLSMGEDIDINPIIEKLTNLGKTAGSFAASEISAQTALNACYGSREFAKMINNALESDARILHTLEETLGTKEAHKFKKEVKSLAKDNFTLLGKRINIRRALNKARVAQCHSLMASVQYTMKQFKRSGSKVKDAMNATAENSKLMQHGGVVNNLKAKGNEVKQKAKLAKLYVTDPTARSIINSGAHHYFNNQDVKDVTDKVTGTMKMINKKKKEYWDDRKKQLTKRDRDTVDYNLKTNSGDYSSQSVLSFLTGADKRRVEKEKRRRLLDNKK